MMKAAECRTEERYKEKGGRAGEDVQLGVSKNGGMHEERTKEKKKKKSTKCLNTCFAS